MKKILLFFLFSFSLLGTSWAQQQDKVYGLLFETNKYSDVYDVFGINTYIGYYDQGDYPTEDLDEYVSDQYTPQTTYYYTTLGSMSETNPILVHHEIDETATSVDVQGKIPWDMKIFFYPDDPNNPDNVGSVKFEYIDAYHGDCEMVQNQRFPISPQIRYICAHTDNGNPDIPGDPIFFKDLYFLHIWNESRSVCEDDTITLNYGWDWQYKLDNGSWTTLTNHAGERTLNLSLSDILPPGTSSGQLHFKTGYNGNWLENNIITFDIVPCAPGLDSVDVINPSCYNGNDGEFVLHLDRTPNPGEVFHIQGKRDGQVFAYSSTSSNVIWNGNTVTINNLYAGSYTDIQYYVVVNNHTSNPVGISDITLTPPDTVSIDQFNVTNVTCNDGHDGAINIDVSGGSWNGGTVSYFYQYNLDNSASWSNWIDITDGQNLNYQTGITYPSLNIDNLHPGHYDLKIGAIANNRTIVCGGNTISFDITQPDIVEVNNTSIHDVSCYGGSDGSIELEFSGGNGHYEYNVDNNNWITVSGTRDTIRNLSAGSYDIYIKDTNNCPGDTLHIDINQPNKVKFSASKTDVTCHDADDGTITIDTILGGSESYYYSITSHTLNVQNVPIDEIPFTLSNLVPDIYRLYIKDSNGCVGYANPPDYNDASIRFRIREPAELTLNISKTDVTCNGRNDGTASLTASGGTEGYQYQIENGSWTNFTNQNTTEITGLSAGSYTIMVRDSHNCEVQGSIEIQQPTAINIQFNNVVAPSPNQANGSVKALITGGTPLLNNGNLSTTSYTCVWHDDNNQIITSNNEIINGEFYTDISNVPAGNYSVEITDNNNCPSTDTIALDVINVIISITQPILCHGDTGTLKATASGGDGTYSYEWYLGSVDPNNLIGTSVEMSGLYAGTYIVVLTDNSGATASDTITLSEPSLLELDSLNTQNVSCNGGSDGEAEIIVTGGTDTNSYNFEWSKYINNQWEVINYIGNTNTATNLHAGDYKVVVTDSLNCILQDNGNDFVQFNIAQPQDSLQINLVETVPASVFGASDASISFTVQGGTSGYNVTCKDGNNTNHTITNSNNQYHVNNIPNGSYTINVEDANSCTESINVNIDFEVSLSIQTPIYCNGGLGTLSATASGGSGTYNNYQWYEIDNGQGNLIPNQNTSTLQVPAGTYKVCVSDDDNHRVCSSPKELLQPQAIDTTQVNITDVSCYGGNNGSIHIEVSGGYSGQYIYEWSGHIFTANSQDIIISDLEAGNYSIIIKDAQHTSCMVLIDNLVVSQPASALSISNSTVTNVNHIGQAEGAIDINVAGGTPSYTYTWNGTSLDVTNQMISLNNLEAGTYDVPIVDHNNCSVNEHFIITQPDEISYNIYYSDILCNGDTTEVSLQNITGGRLINNETYSCKWYNNTNNLLGAGISRTLSAGSYKVEVLDSYQNMTTQSFTISEPEAISATYTVQDVSCYGEADGSINFSVSSGTPSQTGNPYTYSWTDNHGNRGFGLDNLHAGTYDVTITDANNCSLLVQHIVIDQPTQILIESDPNLDIVLPSAGQQNGLIRVNVSDGQPGYTYQWYVLNQNDNTYDIISGATTNELSGIGEGTYQVVVTDSQNCEAEAVYILGVLQPMTVAVNQTSSIDCFGGNEASLEAIAGGGAGEYQYEWHDATGQVISSVSSQTITGLPAGEYYVEVSDLRGNTVISDHFVVLQPNAIEVQSQTSFTGWGNANDWDIDLDIQGGTPPYTFEWNTGDTTQNLTQVAAGNYLVVITDDNGCQKITPVIINPPSLMQITESIQQPTCHDACDGNISLSINGGTPPYDVQWDNGSNGQNIQDLCPGTYIATVSDSSGCILTQNYDLINPDSIPLDLGNDILTCGNNPVSFNISIADPNVTYQWTGPNGFTSNSPVVQLYDEGDYTASITNSSNCTVSDQIHISNIENTYHTDFLVATQVYENEEVVLVNTSNPISPNTTWIVPPSVQIISETNERITLKFPVTGFYDISLRSSYANGCYQDYTKTIIVDEQSNLPDNGNSTLPFILDFSVYPNPTSGDFTVTVHLQSQASVSLRLYSLVTNALLDTRILNDILDVNETYQLQLPAGIYVLLLETPQGSEVRKVIVQ